MGFPGGSDGKESVCNEADMDLIPELGRSLGEGNGNPLQYSFLENSMDREACGCKRVAQDSAIKQQQTNSESILKFKSPKYLI